MDVLISTGSLAPRSIADAAYVAQASGADGLELLLDGHLLAVGPEIAREIADERDVPIRSVHPALRVAPRVTQVHEDVIAAARYAAQIPTCRTVVMHTVSGVGLHTETGRAFLRTVQEASAILEHTGARLAVENRSTLQPQPRLEFLDRPLNLYRVCEEWDVDITFDTAHAAAFGLNVVSALDVVLPRLRNVHLSDRREDPLPISNSFLNALLREHQMPGDGKLPLGDLLNRLRARHYTGLVTLELSPFAVGAWSTRHAIQRFTRAIQFVRNHTAIEHLPAADPPRRPKRTPTPADGDS